MPMPTLGINASKIDFDLLQWQKRTLLRVLVGQDEATQLHLTGVIELCDALLDDAESRGVWNYDQWKRTNLGMFTHVNESADWEEWPLTECVALVEAKGARELEYAANDGYDDGIRSFQCCAPCDVCDAPEEVPQ